MASGAYGTDYDYQRAVGSGTGDAGLATGGAHASRYDERDDGDDHRSRHHERDRDHDRAHHGAHGNEYDGYADYYAEADEHRPYHHRERDHYGDRSERRQQQHRPKADHSQHDRHRHRDHDDRGRSARGNDVPAANGAPRGTGAHTGRDAQARYGALRQEAYEAKRALDAKRREHEAERMRCMQELDARFHMEVADLAESYHEKEDRIENIQRAALRRLQREEAGVVSDPRLSPEQKVRRVRELREEFLRLYRPDDDYERHEAENGLEAMLSALLAASGLGGVLGGVGGGTVLVGAGPGGRAGGVCPVMRIMGPVAGPSPSAGRAGDHGVRIEELVDDDDEDKDDHAAQGGSEGYPARAIKKEARIEEID